MRPTGRPLAGELAFPAHINKGSKVAIWRHYAICTPFFWPGKCEQVCVCMWRLTRKCNATPAERAAAEHTHLPARTWQTHRAHRRTRFSAAKTRELAGLCIIALAAGTRGKRIDSRRMVPASETSTTFVSSCWPAPDTTRATAESGCGGGGGGGNGETIQRAKTLLVPGRLGWPAKARRRLGELERRSCNRLGAIVAFRRQAANANEGEQTGVVRAVAAPPPPLQRLVWRSVALLRRAPTAAASPRGSSRRKSLFALVIDRPTCWLMLSSSQHFWAAQNREGESSCQRHCLGCGSRNRNCRRRRRRTSWPAEEADEALLMLRRSRRSRDKF